MSASDGPLELTQLLGKPRVRFRSSAFASGAFNCSREFNLRAVTDSPTKGCFVGVLSSGSPRVFVTHQHGYFNT